MDKERFEAGVAFARAWAQYVSQSFLGGETLAEALRCFMNNAYLWKTDKLSFPT